MSGPDPVRSIPGGVRLEVLVQPRASRSEVTGLHDGRIRIRLAAPPVDGAANEELIRFLASALDVAASAVRIHSGGNSRRKTIVAEGATLEAALRLIR